MTTTTQNFLDIGPKAAAVVLVLSLLSGCNPRIIQENWNRADESDNQIQVLIAEYEKNPGTYVVNATNINRTWVGHMAGEADKIPARKENLIGYAKAEVDHFCNHGGFTFLEEPAFGMQDESGAAYGLGILGDIIAASLSSDKNLPTYFEQDFTCTIPRSPLPKATQPF